MESNFTKLNVGWNADPNVPLPEAQAEGDTVILEFRANPYQYPSFAVGERIRVLFRGVWRYGFSTLNDEGWYLGQCRFGKRAPKWGEFYEVSGDLMLDGCEVEWEYLSDEHRPGTRHFLFYFRDYTFECDASSWEILTWPNVWWACARSAIWSHPGLGKMAPFTYPSIIPLEKATGFRARGETLGLARLWYAPVLRGGAGGEGPGASRDTKTKRNPRSKITGQCPSWTVIGR